MSSPLPCIRQTISYPKTEIQIKQGSEQCESPTVQTGNKGNLSEKEESFIPTVVKGYNTEYQRDESYKYSLFVISAVL